MPDTVPPSANPVIPCMFCGQPEHVEIFEVWGHEWMFETCCEGLHEQLAIEMAEDPEWAKRFLRTLDLEVLCGCKLRRVADDGACGVILDWALEIREIDRDCAKRFIVQHHAHCRVPVTWRFHTGIYNGRTLLGAALVGNPVAPALNASRTRSTGSASVAIPPPRCVGMRPPCSMAGAPARPRGGDGGRSLHTRAPTSPARHSVPPVGKWKAA